MADAKSGLLGQMFGADLHGSVHVVMDAVNALQTGAYTRALAAVKFPMSWPTRGRGNRTPSRV